MRNVHDSGWSHLRAGLVGALVAAVVMLSFPAVAAVGGNLILGKSNSADAVTTLSGAAATNLRLTNTQAGSAALDLRVEAGSPPLKVNSTIRVQSLNSDLLDGRHSSAFALSGHLHAGVYLPLAGVAADSSLLDGLDSTAFALSAHPHSALDVAFGTLDEARYSAYSDLGVEGYLDNDAAGDLLTRAQEDGRFLGIVAKAADSSLLDGLDSTAFGRAGAICPPGTSLVGYGRSGPVCSAATGSTAVDTAGDVGEHTSLVLDASGNPVIAYFDATNGDLRVAHCNDPNCAGGDEAVHTVDDGGVGVTTGQYPSLMLDASGYPVISYYQATFGDLMLAHCYDPDCAGPGTFFRAVDSTEDDVGEFTSLVLDASGRPVIAYFDVTHGDLRVAHCNDPNCAGGDEAVHTVDDGGVGVTTGQYASLMLDASGYPVISYYQATAGDLMLAHCYDPDCAGPGTFFRAVDTAGSVGLFTSLALDASGHPVISYYHDTNDDLRVAHCNDANCSGADESLQAVDTAGDVGSYGSMVLNASGFPVISYQDDTGGGLRVALCNDANCAGADEALKIIDATGFPGQFTSLVLDASGHPVVSYHDAGNGDLRLAVWVG